MQSYVLTYNEFVIASDKKVGFKEEGTMKEHVYQGGNYQDALIIGLTKKDFFQINNLQDYIV